MRATDLLTEQPTEALVTEQLREVIDPELGVNIVDLRLLRSVAVTTEAEVAIAMTLTTQPARSARTSPNRSRTCSGNC